MISKSSASYVRISPRKVRYVIDMIRNKPVIQALSILSGSPRRARTIIEKLLTAAVDAAERNSNIAASSLFVSKVTADGGPTMKRFRAMSMGRAGVIRKRTSHIQLELSVLKGHEVAPKEQPTKEGVKKTKATGTAKASTAKSKTLKKTASRGSKKLAGAK